MEIQEEKKPCHSIVLDAGPILTNNPGPSTLRNQSEQLFTTPSVLAEIKDPAARSRLDTFLLPFLTIRSPRPASLKFASDFARKSGDLAALSRTDLEVIALAYDLECERNHGDWRLRNNPGQKTLNGSPPKHEFGTSTAETKDEAVESTGQIVVDGTSSEESHTALTSSTHRYDQIGSPEDRTENVAELKPANDSPNTEQKTAVDENSDTRQPRTMWASIAKLDSSREADTIASMSTLKFQDEKEDQPNEASELSPSHQASVILPTTSTEHPDHPSNDSNLRFPTSPSPSADDAPHFPEDPISNSDSDSEGWITPSNLSSYLSASPSTPSNSKTTTKTKSSSSPSKPPQTLQVATLTTDFALQNVLLLMNLNLLSSTPSMHRVTTLKTTLLRCHACFTTTKDPTRQFCHKCGKPTLTRVTCTINSKGETKLHLKKRMEWHHRGDRYSVPKPVGGSASGKKGKGGGKGGWGRDLILAEDQVEYTRAKERQERERRREEKEMGSGMGWGDEMPGLLTGERRSGGRVKVGAGRDVNARRRRG